MAQDEEVIYLGHTANWPECPKTRIEGVQPGCVAVEVVDCSLVNGLLYVSEAGGYRFQRDMGYVVGVGEGVELSVGDFVIVRGYDGLWKSKTLRFYGVGTPWWDQIPARLDGDCLIPQHDWVHVEFDPLTSFIQGLHEVFYSSGTVIAAGPAVEGIKVGDRVEAKNGHPRNLDFKYDWAKPSWGFLPASAIKCTYNETMKIAKPLWTNVLIRGDEPPAQMGSILLTDFAADQMKSQEGEIIALGDDVNPRLQVGMRVLYSKYGGHEFQLDKDDKDSFFLVTPESNIYSEIVNG